MARMLSAGRTKVTLLTTKPANVGAPTATELNAGHDLSDMIPRSNFSWTAGDPTTETDSPISAEFDAEVPIAKTYSLGFGLYRQFLTAGGFDATAEAAFDAVKEMGGTVWVYARKTDKLSGEAWEAADEIYLGGEVVSGGMKVVDGGYLKFEASFYPVDLFDYIEVAAGA